LTRVDADWKIRNRRQRTEKGKYAFANRAIQPWNKLPMNGLGILPSKPIIFGKGRKVIIEVK